jgi:hypothetical protein
MRGGALEDAVRAFAVPKPADPERYSLGANHAGSADAPGAGTCAKQLRQYNNRSENRQTAETFGPSPTHGYGGAYISIASISSASIAAIAGGKVDVQLVCLTGAAVHRHRGRLLFEGGLRTGVLG